VHGHVLRERTVKTKELSMTQEPEGDRLAHLEQVIARQQEQITRLEAVLAQTVAPLSVTEPTSAEAPAGTPMAGHRGRTSTRSSRRALLQMGGAAAAAGVAAAALGTRQEVQAQADTVNTWTTSVFTADTETAVLSSPGFPSPDVLQVRMGVGTVYQALISTPHVAALAAYDATGNPIGIGAYGSSSNGAGVYGNTDTGTGVYGNATGAYGAGVYATSNNGTGVYATGSNGVYATGEFNGVWANSSNGTGVLGQSSTGVGVYGGSNSGFGVHGDSTWNYGVMGTSTNSYGGYFRGGLAAIYLKPVFNPGPPATGNHFFGEFQVDVNAVIWYCVTSGTPGGWVRLPGVANGTRGGAISYLSTPVRLLDARSSASSGLVNRGALAGNEIFPFGVAGLGGIPSTAQGLIGNVTLLGPSGTGNLSLFPAGGAVPTVASMTFGTAGLFLANGVNVAIGAGGKINIQNQSDGTTPLVLDAVAYVN
jgi:hypothetical protein